jgi:HEAT repeat protein
MNLMYRSLAVIVLLSLMTADLSAASTDELCQRLKPWSGGNADTATQLRNKTHEVMAPGASAVARREHEAALLHALGTRQDPAIRAHLLRELQLVGTAATVRPVAQLLGDAQLCEPAVNTLVRIYEDSGEPEILKHLQAAYISAKGEQRLLIAKTMGRLKISDQAVVTALIADAAEATPQKEVALLALARIGSPAAVNTVITAAQNATGYRRMKYLSWELLYAERLHEHGHSQRAVTVCRGLLKKLKEADTHLINRGLTTLAAVAEEDISDDLLAAVRIDRPDVSDTVVAIFAKASGKTVDTKLAAALGDTHPTLRIVAMRVLLQRHLDKAAAYVVGGLNDEDGSVRIAAAAVAAAIMDEAVAKKLADLLLSGDDAERQAAQSALMAAPFPGVGPELAARYSTAKDPAQKEMLLQILAHRRDHRQMPTFVAAARDADKTVRKAAIKGLPRLATAKDLKVLLGLMYMATGSERMGLQTALVAAVQESGDPDDRARPFINELHAQAGKYAEPLLQIIGRIGGPAALTTIAAAARSSNTDEAIAAVRVLAKWPNPSALESLFSIAQNTSVKTHRILALRGVVRLAATDGANITPSRFKDLHRLIAGVEDEQLRPSVRAAIQGLANLALDRALVTSGPPEGNHVKALANDGDENTYWSAGSDTGWIEVDLGEPAEIDTVHVQFIANGSRYYQHRVDVSTDRRVWTVIADRSGATTAASKSGEVERFPKVSARYVRVHAKRRAHVRELRVYAAGFAPADLKSPPPAPSVAEEGPAPKSAAGPVPATLPPDSDGFTPLFNGIDLNGWKGATTAYKAIDGKIVLKSGGGELYTAGEYDDFVFRFDFLLTPGANNGLGIRYPGHGDAAHTAIEIQILDDSHPKYAKLKPNQYHGSIYFIEPARRGFLKPTGQWNTQEVVAMGRRIQVVLNGEVITDCDLGTSPRGQQHGGAQRSKGHIAFLGHGTHVEFRNVRIKPIVASDASARTLMQRSKAFDPVRPRNDSNRHRLENPDLTKREVAKGKPLKSSGEARGTGQFGKRGPEHVNDGVEGKGSAWWAAAPYWVTVDLQKPTEIGQIWIQPWWDEGDAGRVSKHHVEVSTDNLSWHTIADLSDHTTPSTAAGHTHRFEPSIVRYVRVKNVRQICEIRVFGGGK